MKTKLLSIASVLLVTVACLFNNSAKAQIAIDEYCCPAVVPIDDFNKVEYDKCRGVLNVGLSSSTGSGTWFMFKSYVYIKVNGTWKKLLTLRGVNYDLNSGSAAGTGTTGGWSSGTDVTTTAWSPAAFTNVTSTCLSGENPAFDNRIAYANGAFNHFYWASYEDANYGELYDANANLTNGSSLLYLAAYGNPPRMISSHSSNITTNLAPIGFYPTNGAEWGIEFGIANLPQIAIQGNSVNIRVYKHFRSMCCPNSGADADNSYQVCEYSTSINAIDAPFGLTASTNQCGQVTLNWQNPAQTWSSTYNCSNTQTYKNVIYRDGVKIAVINDDLSQYVDNSVGLAPRLSYNYTVKKLLWNLGDVNFRISSPSNVAAGTMKLPPAQPSPFTASSDKCDTLISTTWSQPNGTSVASYKFVTSVYTCSIVASDRSYDWETNVVRGTNYTVKLVALNDCGYPSDTASVTGISPADPMLTNPTSITTNTVDNSSTITWLDLSNNETKYQVERQDDAGNSVLFDVNANATSFTDNSMAPCRVYKYYVKVYNSCVLNGVKSNTFVTAILPPPNLGNTFDASHKLVASKGYFNTRVELAWTNINNNVLSNINIYRKVLGSSLDSVQIASLSAGNGLYSDNTADAGILYKYTIVGEAYCVGTSLFSNISEDIGFRVPSAIVNGHIQYDGAVAVKDVKISVEKTLGSPGKASSFNGSGYLSAASSSLLTPTLAVTAEAWVRFSDIVSDKVIIEKANSYSLKYNSTTNKVEFAVWSGTMSYTAVYQNTLALTVNNYYHFCGVYDGTNVKLYYLGLLTDSQAGPSSINTNNNPLTIGGDGTNNFSGKLDEIRVWDIAKTAAAVKIDYERILTGSETGLAALYHADEGFGSAVYDISHVGTVYNANHANTLTGSGFSFSTTVPIEMGYIGYTDSLGDYGIDGVRYAGGGENFKITPKLGVHSFNPGNKILFLGDGTAVFNGIDFIDKSSFQVTGTVRYSPVNDCNCFVEGAFLNIDGAVVVKAGAPVKTNALGYFDINVPIGEHFVSVTQSGHTYLKGRYPTDTTLLDFEDRVPGIEFIDSTFVKVIGKVVGGTREEGKPMIPGRSVNNIGKVNITFKTQNGCYTKTITTSPVSGDYTVFLPPFKYTISDFSTTNLGSPNFVTFQNGIFTNNDLLDVSSIPPVQTIRDTIFTDTTHTAWNPLDIDSVHYQKIRNWIYREVPTIWVKDKDWNNYTTVAGDTSFIYKNQVTNSNDTLPITAASFGYPVFTQHKPYKFNVGAVEIYTNKDYTVTVTDQVPVTKGIFTINNALAADPITLIKIDTAHISLYKDTAYAAYSFIGGNPNTAYTSGDVSNFLQQLSISFASGPNNVAWLPGAGNTPFKGVLMGSRSSDGQGFVSVGPQVPEFILRDPPGTASYASLEKGSAITLASSWSVAEEAGVSLSKQVLLGTKFTIGLGMSTPTTLENQLTLNASVGTTIGQEGDMETTITTNDAWQTSEDIVGAMGDIFMGKAMNVNFGVSDNIGLMPSANCALSGVSCRTETVSIAGTSYSVAKRKSLAVAPGGYATSFFYTQDHIVNKLIPRLKELRNQLFVDKPAVYTAVITDIEDPNYSRNNDDPVFGKPPYNPWSVACTNCPSSKDPYSTDPSDVTGLSYTFTSPGTTYTVNITSTSGIPQTLTMPARDSIRWYNQQIRLWEEAVILNEKEKYEALQDPSSLLQNYSYSGGVTFTRSLSNERSETTTNTFEVAISTEAGLKIGADVGGTGLVIGGGITVGVTTGGSKSRTEVNSSTYAFTLSDPNVGDVYSVDVRKSKKGFGNMFNIQAGETSCPWEGITKSVFYKPTGSPVILSGGTLRREYPEMKVDGSPSWSKKVNIPSDGFAVYDLEIINNTETHDDIEYAMKVLSNTNPNGAMLTIDGVAPSDQLYAVPDGGSIHKQLVLTKGATALDYDSIAVVVGSACGDENVGDTIYVSAHFLPGCTDVKVSYPLNQWVVNNSFNDTLPIIIDGYDINYSGLKNIKFEYKKSSEASWVGLQTWHKFVDTPGPDSLSISQGNAYTSYQWGLKELPDGNYDIRAGSTCPLADQKSVVLTGVLDRINPAPFGTPSPADGILDPNDDISIQFNEPINIGTLTYNNFDIRGVLNGTPIRHSESLNFDGVAGYVQVSGGANLQKRDFTLEFWAKLNAAGINQTVISQGTDAAQRLAIGFDTGNKLLFKLGNVSVSSNAAIVGVNNWHHYAVTYDFAAQAAYLYYDGTLQNSGNTSISYDYNGSGKLVFGKELPGNTNYFNGNMHEVRLWTTKRSSSDIVVSFAKELNRSTSGLLYNWKMNEAEGTVAKDDIRSRNADISASGVTWEINPNGNAVQFDGVDDRIEIPSGTIPITKEMDFTLEFWFNSNQAGAATLFSNGKGDGVGSDSLVSWNIQKDVSGKIHVYHKGYDFVAASTNYFDGKWHHFALVMQRTANLSSYIDGKLENSVQAVSFQEMGGAKMYLGTRGYRVGAFESFDNPFDGKMDEFRFWNTARKSEQIKRDKQNRLLGDEFALQAYLPFESYKLVLGTPILAPSFSDYSVNTVTVVPQNGPILISQTPTIKLPRPVQAVNYTWALNNDKIILTPTTAPELIENVTLDVTVKNANDLHGNTMQSPKTWIAYINKNQVKWQDADFNFEKPSDSTITFSTKVVNSGGAQKAFNIAGLPAWLSANITSGVVGPNSSQTIVFTVAPGQSVGQFVADVSLTTDFNYSEILRVNVKVRGVVPNWSVNSSNFQYSMNIFGEFKIDGVISTNSESKIAAFNNGVLCGTGNLQYLSAYDRYEVFLNVYNNKITGDSIQFNIYDASTGLTFITVKPNIMFVENDVVGTVINPVTFEANSEIQRDIQLNAGWTWVSFPLKSNKLRNSNLLLSSVNASTGDVALSISEFDQYDPSSGWIGNISQGAGFFNNQSYKIKTANVNTIMHKGTRLHPDSSEATMNVQPGWNWLGYVSTKNVSLSEAMGNYNAVTGDLIKSQYEFAYYDNSNGWTGSLTHMKPAMGYMLKSSGTSSFHYPVSVFVGGYGKKEEENSQPLTQNLFPFTPEQYDNTMSVIVSGNICSIALEQGNIALGAFDAANTLRGYAFPVKTGTTYQYYVTLYSNVDGESFRWKYFNATEGTITQANTFVTFAGNALTGTPSSPVVVNVDPVLTCDLVNSAMGITDISSNNNVSIYPNPFTDNLTLSFIKAVNCKVELVDIMGRVLYSSVVKNKKEFALTIENNSSVSSGVYYLRLSGDINEQIKVVKIK